MGITRKFGGVLTYEMLRPGRQVVAIVLYGMYCLAGNLSRMNCAVVLFRTLNMPGNVCCRFLQDMNTTSSRVLLRDIGCIRPNLKNMGTSLDVKLQTSALLLPLPRETYSSGFICLHRETESHRSPSEIS